MIDGYSVERDSVTALNAINVDGDVGKSWQLYQHHVRLL
jgi:hypothetical protein